MVYTGYMNFLWNDSTLEKRAIGGAEKAVIYLTRNLSKKYKKFKIYIIGDQEEEEIDNIRYIHRDKLQKILDENEFYAIIVSRFVSFFEMYKNIRCYKLILSAHDITGFINYPTNKCIKNLLNIYNDKIDIVIALTKWHASNIIERYSFLRDKINIINNGIDIDKFPTIENNKIENNKIKNKKIKNKFIWSSCSYRGLHILLNLWDKLLEKIPEATLDICSYDTFPKNDNDKKMLNIIDKHPSITHHGKLDIKQLYDLMSISEYWLYTNTFPETSCITAMEMLMSEVICLYYPLAGLVDTIGEYGIKVNQGEEIETIMKLNEDDKNNLRKKGKEYALNCSWKNRSERWEEILYLNKKWVFYCSVILKRE